MASARYAAAAVYGNLPETGAFGRAVPQGLWFDDTHEDGQALASSNAARAAQSLRSRTAVNSGPKQRIARWWDARHRQAARRTHHGIPRDAGLGSRKRNSSALFRCKPMGVSGGGACAFATDSPAEKTLEVAGFVLKCRRGAQLPGPCRNESTTARREGLAVMQGRLQVRGKLRRVKRGRGGLSRGSTVGGTRRTGKLGWSAGIETGEGLKRREPQGRSHLTVRSALRSKPSRS